MLLLANVLASFVAGSWVLLNATSVPLYALCFAPLAVAAFIAASTANLPSDCERWRDLAAAVNGAAMLMLSGLAVMCIAGVLNSFLLFSVFAAGALLTAWNLVSLTATEAAQSTTAPLRLVQRGGAVPQGRTLPGVLSEMIGRAQDTAVVGRARPLENQSRSLDDPEGNLRNWSPVPNATSQPGNKQTSILETNPIVFFWRWVRYSVTKWQMKNVDPMYPDMIKFIKDRNDFESTYGTGW